MYNSRTPLTRTLQGNENSSSYLGIRVIRVNFSEIVTKGKEIYFELSRFYCIGTQVSCTKVLTAFTRFRPVQR